MIGICAETGESRRYVIANLYSDKTLVIGRQRHSAGFRRGILLAETSEENLFSFAELDLDNHEEQEEWLTEEEAERIDEREADDPLRERCAARSASDEPETEKCLECGAEIYEDAPRCPACGVYFPHAGPRKQPPESPFAKGDSMRWMWLTAILCILLILVFWIPGTWHYLYRLILATLK